MPQSQPHEQDLLKSILQPLLDDFQYWFSRSHSLLESEEISFLSRQQQRDLLERVKIAQREVNAAVTLFQATDGQVGIEPATLVPWHRLVNECWQVGMRWRSLKSGESESEISGNVNIEPRE
ncbi:MAG: DUF2605 domain-containing protein [Coleofasciculus sp. A1-SPW-01]|uniref:DUF2605 domain-containing protein n=1 Tax=Coleofasciculus sp. A1-SPW-01 TaxID=3070819 RepID=UPI0032FF344D